MDGLIGDHDAMNLIDLLSQPWAITRAAMMQVHDIVDRHARGEAIDIDALEARLGRPLRNTRAVTLRGDTAIVPVTGPIMRYANLLTEISGATSLQLLARDFAAAQDDPAVARVVLVLDTPGGQASGIAEFAQQVRIAKKPTIAYVDNAACSAGYWIAAAADRLVMAKSAVVGSIGTVLSVDRSRDDGPVEIVSSQSPHKRPDVTTDAGRAQLQTLVDQLAQVFVDDVAAYRGVDAADVLEKFGGGAVKIASDAVAVGMADEIGTLETLLASFDGRRTGGLMTTDTTALTLDTLRANHPQIYQAALAEGARAELARVLEVQAQLVPGHEALVAECVSDGKTTGPQTAVRILAAEKAQRAAMLEKIRGKAAPPVPHATASQQESDDVDETPSGSRQRLHAKAKAHQAAHPGCSYFDAIAAVAA